MIFPFQVCVIIACNKTESTDYFNMFNKVAGLLVFKFAIFIGQHRVQRTNSQMEGVSR